MENKEFAKELEKRTKKFAVSIIRLSAMLPGTVKGKVVRTQITKSGTSVGANYREANRARSKTDFRNKISISESESSESGYWLEIIEEMKWIDPSILQPVYNELNELLAIFTSIGKSLNE
jgi:four helix bundle protein